VKIQPVAYRLCDLTVESTIPLPELNRAVKKDVQCFFELLPARPQDSEPCRWFHEWCLPDGDPTLLFGRYDGGYVFRFPDLADFLVSQDANHVRCLPCPNTPVETIRHLFLDQIVPIVLSGNGSLVLHGSAVSTPHGAIAFVGATGQGKSTLALSLSESGGSVLTDDCLLLKEENGRLLAIPSYPGMRIWPDTVDALFGQEPPLAEVAHYTEKKRIGRNVGLSFCVKSAAVRRIYFLTPADEGTSVSIVPLSARESCVELVKFTYRLDITDRQRLRQEFERLSRVAALPLFYLLSFPRDFSLLPDVHRAILENARG